VYTDQDWCGQRFDDYIVVVVNWFSWERLHGKLRVVVGCIQWSQRSRSVQSPCRLLLLYTSNVQLVTSHWRTRVAVWRSGSVVRRTNEVTRRWARLVLGWVPFLGRYTISGIKPKGQLSLTCLWGYHSLLWLGNVSFAGWRVILSDPMWHVRSGSGEVCCKLLYPVTLLHFTILHHVYVVSE